jgi:hypothetical protein
MIRHGELHAALRALPAGRVPQQHKSKSPWNQSNKAPSSRSSECTLPEMVPGPPPSPRHPKRLQGAVRRPIPISSIRPIRIGRPPRVLALVHVPVVREVGIVEAGDLPHAANTFGSQLCHEDDFGSGRAPVDPRSIHHTPPSHRRPLRNRGGGCRCSCTGRGAAVVEKQTSPQRCE